MSSVFLGVGGEGMIPPLLIFILPFLLHLEIVAWWIVGSGYDGRGGVHRMDNY